MNVKSILKKNGIKRIGPKAIKQVEDYVVMKVKDVSAQSKLLCDHAGRKTVSEEDVKLALLVVG